MLIRRGIKKNKIIVSDFRENKEPKVALNKKTEKKSPKNDGADLLVKTNEQVQTPESKEVIFNRSDIERMSDEVFMQYEKDIVKAQREGRIK